MRNWGMACIIVIVLSATTPIAAEVRVATFDVDASPPIGSMMAYDPTIGVQTPLRCRGIILLSDQQPLVLCAVDWIGISSGGQTVFRERLARAAGTSAKRVVVHTLHQHDAPRCDFAADELLADHGGSGLGFDAAFARDVVDRAATAVGEAVHTAQPVTHLGLGVGTVEKVASNRRILGEDGKVQYTRYTATKDPKIRAFPAGTIDPQLKLISFWNGDTPLAALTYYATHPQSYYRTGLANADFPGLARDARETATGVIHVHFNGAGGNIGAGKWNDGSPENRQVLADRVAAGMQAAWEATEKVPLEAEQIGWESVPVLLPVAPHLEEQSLLATLQNREAKPADRFTAAHSLVWLRRCQQQDPIDVSCLRLGRARILHLPGELFVEYQLAAQKMQPDLFVALAAYGDYAPGYIGTEVAYSQGGYETSPGASRVAPNVERALLDAMATLLETGS